MRSLIIVLGFLATAGMALASEGIAFQGDNFAAWREAGDWVTAQTVTLNPTNAQQFVIAPGAGLLVNGTKGRAVDLVSKAEFGDVEIHVEFCLPKKSNSGVYVLGRYEVQIYDSYGVTKDKYPGLECGGIYPRYDNQRHEYEGHSPRLNVSKPPGQWQTFDITFRAPRFDASGHKTENARMIKVVHNGVVVHVDVELTGPTHGGYEGEVPVGPLRLQGDHGPVAYRNVRITPRKN